MVMIYQAWSICVDTWRVTCVWLFAWLLVNFDSPGLPDALTLATIQAFQACTKQLYGDENGHLLFLWYLMDGTAADIRREDNAKTTLWLL